jgi:hypothetical protein
LVAHHIKRGCAGRVQSKDAERESELVRSLRRLQDRCKEDIDFVVGRLETFAAETAARDEQAARCVGAGS